MKVCPKCGKQWPKTGKFCPMDGTPLVVEGDDFDSRPTRLLGPDEVPRGISAAFAPPPANVEPVSAESRGEASISTPAAPPPATVEPVSTPTKSPDQAPGPPEDRPTAEPKSTGTFSETKWFMVGEHIKDEEIEASDLPLEDLQEIYKRTGVLPEEVRKKYSLRYGTEEDGASGRDSQK